MTPPEAPDGKEVVVVQNRKIIDGLIITQGIARPVMIAAQVLGEALKELPDPDYIEITLVRYDVVDKEDSGERSTQPAPDPEPPADR